jgi:hypothetical protein
MGALRAWVHRRRVLAAFLAGAALTVAALAIVGYLVLADQRRSARVLAAALSRALAREVRIERVTDLGPSRVRMRGVHLPAERGWPADVHAESVEASGPLLAAARGEAAPVRVIVTHPKVVTGAGGGSGAAILEGLRQGVRRVLTAPGLYDIALTSGELEVPGPGDRRVTFDLTLRKGAGEAHGELVARARQGRPFTLTLDARGEGEHVQLGLAGAGPLGPLDPWLPGGLARAAADAPVDLRAELGFRTGDRADGRVTLRLGSVLELAAAVALEGELVRLREGRGAVDLPFALAVLGRPGAATGTLELAGGELAWRPGAPGAPTAAATVRLARGTLPAALLGADTRVTGLEAQLALAPAGGGAVARGDVRAAEIRVADLELAAIQSDLRLALDERHALAGAELTGLTARLAGAPLRGAAAYDGSRGLVDARLETAAAPLDGLARRFAPEWLGPADRLRAAALRLTVAGLRIADLGEGQADADVRDLALRRPDGEAAVGQARARATFRPGATAVTLEAERVRAALPVLDGTLPRLEATAELARTGGAAALRRLSLVAHDGERREMLRADVGREGGGPVRLTARAPALERLAGLWPSVQRRVRGTATLALAAPDVRFAAFEGRLALDVPEAELLDGRLSLRDLSAEMPVTRGPGRGTPAPGPLTVGELIGYGVVAHDVTGRARVSDQRLAVSDLQYALYAGEGRGSLEGGLGPGGGLAARARLRGERVRIEEFMAAYGIRGGTMTGLLRYDLDVRYGSGRLGADGQFAVPDGGTVTIELLERLFQYTAADPTGVVRRALENLRSFDYRSADATVRTASDDIRVSLSLHGRERFGIFPPRVKEINVREMPLGFLARQFPMR